MQTGTKNIWQILGIIAWVLLIPAITYVATIDYKMSLVLFGGIIGTAMVVATLLNFRLGYFMLLTFGLTVRVVERMSGMELSIGVPMDLLLFVVLIGSLINNKDKSMSKVDFFRDPLLITFYVYIAYLLIQFFNPNIFQRTGWTTFMRVFMRNMLFIYVTMKMIRSMNDVKLFFKFWLIISTLAALYGCIQQWFGLMPFEKNYIALYPEKFKTVVILTGIRIFSFMSDPAVFGLLMACGIIICVILLTAKKTVISLPVKLMLLVSLFLHMMSLGYSGTRTGYVMVPMGLLIFFLANLHRRNTVIMAVVFGMFAVLVLYGPFYGSPTIVRVRTAFVGSEDASLNVRDINRHRIQPYIYTHPIGGGVLTSGEEGKTYNPGHVLAGFPPDSGYLRVALEMGWIGIIIVGINTFLVLQYAVVNYFRSKTELDGLLLISIAAVVFSMAVGQYAQEAAGLIESAFLLNALTGISIKLKYLQLNNKQ
ncbi:O-antigen ligase family protein [Chitinophaga sp. XS-30]|uniref:O-antigen ligase family protein n=1 Tax=Chitinophaga sp. XS-30 TaxID=2604421 RepID=UPI0011DDD40A|nr:O-antigen ligase family protein [Chitinophaga sp. XS-30]QEH42595.1 hypothetical protein FW415_17625 [Chitinophaga sp. XS-30]